MGFTLGQGSGPFGNGEPPCDCSTGEEVFLNDDSGFGSLGDERPVSLFYRRGCRILTRANLAFQVFLFRGFSMSAICCGGCLRFDPNHLALSSSQTKGFLVRRDTEHQVCSRSTKARKMG